jgi:hypothetical protein
MIERVSSIERQSQGFDIARRLHQVHRGIDLAKRALDLGVAGMADQHERAALGDVATALVVDLRHQRAGRVERRQAAELRIVLNRTRHAVRAEHGHGTGGHLGKLFDEDGALGPQRIDHMTVVDDLVADVDRGTVFHQRPLDDIDSAHHAGTETARLRKDNLHAFTHVPERAAPLRLGEAVLIGGPYTVRIMPSPTRFVENELAVSLNPVVHRAKAPFAAASRRAFTPGYGAFAPAPSRNAPKLVRPHPGDDVARCSNPRSIRASRAARASGPTRAASSSA